MPDMCAGGYLTGVLQGPFEAWKVVVSVATSALWLLCGFIFRRGATARTGFFFLDSKTSRTVTRMGAGR